MDEADFETFYRATADRLRAYLYRACDERRIVDDLLQEAFYRFLRSKFAGLGAGAAEEQTRYLFRIATNLLKDHWTATKAARGAPEEPRPARPASEGMALRLDLHAALGTLKAADREMLWLAYAEG